MHRLHQFALLATLPLLALAAAAAKPGPLELLVYPNPGVFDVSPRDKVSGPGAVMLKRLAHLAAVDMRMVPVPAVRALQMVQQQQPGRCAAGLPRQPARENLYLWTGRIASGALMLYGRPGETREVNSPEDLRGAVVVAQRESVPAGWLREHGLQAYEVGDTATGLRMLRAGRVDYWLVNDLPARYVIDSGGGPPPKALREFGRIELYLACHRDLDPAVAARLRRGLEQLRRNVELARFGLR